MNRDNVLALLVEAQEQQAWAAGDMEHAQRGLAKLLPQDRVAGSKYQRLLYEHELQVLLAAQRSQYNAAMLMEVCQLALRGLDRC